REQEIYSLYQRDVEVTPALWNGIKTRIEEEKISPSYGILTGLRELLLQVFRAPRFSPALAAALVLVTVGVTVVVMRYITPNTRPVINQPSPEVANNRSKTAEPQQIKDEKNKEEKVAPIEKNDVQQALPAVANNSPKSIKRQPKLAKAPTPEELVRQAEE